MASKNGKLLILDAALTIKKQYKTITDKPAALSANKDFIAVGSGNEVIFYQRYGSEEPTVRIKLR